MQATLDLAMDLNCEFANFYSAMAYPGSPLYDAGRPAGRAAAARRGPATRSTRATACRCRRSYLPAREVLRFRDEAFHTLLHRPALPGNGRAPLRPETVEHIRQMTSYRLERGPAHGQVAGAPVTLPGGAGASRRGADPTRPTADRPAAGGPPLPETTLILVRHGATTANVCRPYVLQGLGPDSELIDLGIAQAGRRASSPGLPDRPGVLFAPEAGPADAQVITASLPCRSNGSRVWSRPTRASGPAWAGAEIEQRWPEEFRAFQEDPERHGYLGGENLAQVRGRVLPADRGCSSASTAAKPSSSSATAS